MEHLRRRLTATERAKLAKELESKSADKLRTELAKKANKKSLKAGNWRQIPELSVLHKINSQLNNLNGRLCIDPYVDLLLLAASQLGLGDERYIQHLNVNCTSD